MQKERHQTPGTYVFKSHQRSQHPRRSHNRLSCNPCRHKKVKCDQARPCRGCLKRGREVECTYGSENVNLSSSSERPTPRSDITANDIDDGHNDIVSINERLRRLESTFNDVRANWLRDDAVIKSGVGSCGKENQSHDYPLRVETDEAPGINVNASQYSVKHQEDWMFRLKDVPYYVGSTAWLHDLCQFEELVVMFRWRKVFAQQWGACNELKSYFPKWKQTYLTAPFTAVAPVAPTQDDLIALLPSREICDVLISRYMATFHLTHPLLDKDGFLTELANFWKTKVPVSTAWLVLLLAIVSIGYRLPVYPSQDANDRSFDNDAEGKRILSGVSTTFFSSLQMQRRPNITSFQILILIILAQKLDLPEPDGIDGQSGLLGVASRMSMSMGLHRDPTVCYGIVDKDAETRRRLWVTFVFLDLEHAIQSGMPFHLTDFDTSIPANGDSADLSNPSDVIARGGFISIPDYQLTDSTYVRYLYRVLPLWSDVKRLCHSYRDKIPCMEIQSLDARLLAAAASVHPHLRPDPSSTSATLPHGQEFAISVQRAIIDCSNQRMRMLLHRGLIGNPFFPESRGVVLSCAQAILGHQRSLYQLAKQFSSDGHDAWLLFALSLLRCDFARAIAGMTRVLHDSTRAGEAPLPDTSAIMATVDEAITTWSESVAFSYDVAKEHMALSQTIAATKERIRLLNEHNLRSIDISSVEAKPIILALQDAPLRCLALSREAINKRYSLDQRRAKTHMAVKTPMLAIPNTRGDPSTSSNGSLLTDPAFRGDMDIGMFFNDSWQSLYHGTVANDPDWWFSQADAYADRDVTREELPC